ncbi:MAG: MiaB/RimO family radical SAM methylthiotransferase, partial [Gammaproteobacteria bacterium]
SRQLIRRIHRENPSAKLVVSGCYATLNPDEAANSMGVDLVIGNGDKDKLVDIALSRLTSENMPAMSTEPGEVSLFSRGRQRAFVKVQDGCRHRCTYCIVTVARGEESSRRAAEIVEEINTLHSQGIQEVILTGVHLGGYGNETGSNLAELVKFVLDETSIPRLRLGSLEPWELPDDFFSLFENPRLMPHLHLPLQSGCDKVLQRMARRCKTATFALLSDQARKQIPHFNLTTDIIVGFPGETDREWRQSIEFIENVGFGHIHIFSYSPREGTRAATLRDRVPHDVKKARSKELYRLAESMKQEWFKKNLGLQFDVLWEGANKPLDGDQRLIFGYTPNYIRVAANFSDEYTPENRIISGTLTSAGNDFVMAKIENQKSYAE